MMSAVVKLREKERLSDATVESDKNPINRGHVQIRDVSVRFGEGEGSHLAVTKTSLDIKPGEFVCILGPSGCGKSTLLNTVAGFVDATSGQVLVDAEQVVGPGPDRGMVFQQYSLFPWKTIKENVAFGPKVGGSSSAGAESLANTFLGMVGLTKSADRFPAELSGGMQQRVGIARALANYPSVLLMDEPFGALDAQTRLMMQENLLSIWSEFKITVVFVTHDVDEAVFLADRVLIMSAAPGQIIDDIQIQLDRPRDLSIATSKNFIDIKKRCLEMIRVQSLKAFEQQNI